jgi:phage gp36-like protein
MSFASRSDLLARSNARRLAQLAVPADMPMVADELLRVVIEGGDTSGFTPEEQTALARAMDAIDKALADADALLVSYGIPPTVQTTLLARLASTVALYYLQGAERMTPEVQEAYDRVIAMLKSYAKGEMPDLVPPDPEAEPPSDDLAIIGSAPRRYRTGNFNEVGL